MSYLHSGSTARAHQTAWNAMQAHLSAVGLNGEDPIKTTWSPFAPSADKATNEVQWLAFLCYLKFERKVKHETGGKYLCGVRSMMEAYGMTVDFGGFPLLKSFKKAWRREQAGMSSGRIKLKVSLTDLESLLGRASIPRVVKAVMKFTFHTLARLGESLSGLQWSGVEWGDDVVRVRLDQSKTDPFRNGSWLVLTRAAWDEVCALLGRTSGTGAIFPGVERKAVVKHLGGQGHSLRRGSPASLGFWFLSRSNQASWSLAVRRVAQLHQHLES
jgi:hypothetical protein